MAFRVTVFSFHVYGFHTTSTNLCTLASTLRKLLYEGVGREVHIARGAAECYMKLRDLPPSAIISVEYERIRCINWFVVWDQKFKNSGVTFAFEKRQAKWLIVALLS